MINKTNWNSYVKGEANCYSWKLERVQARITSNYFYIFFNYINNLRSISSNLILIASYSANNFK